MEEIQLKPLILNPPLNITLVQDGKTLDKLKDFFQRKKEFGWDTETEPKKDYFYRKSRTWQFGDIDEQYMIDWLAFADGDSDLLFNSQGYYGVKLSPKFQPVLDVVKPVLCSNEWLKVGVALGFEYEQAYWNFGIRSFNFYSCDFVERIIYAGIHSLKDYAFFSMANMMARHFKVAIDKELQSSFNLTDPLTEKQIEYGCIDTRLPLGLKKSQRKILEKDNLLEVADIENNAIGSFMDMKIHGWRIDREKWIKLDTENRAKLKEAIAKLDKFFVPIVGSKSNVITDEQVNAAVQDWKKLNEVTELELEIKSEMKTVRRHDLQRYELLKAKLTSLENDRKAAKEVLKKKASELGKQRTKLNKLVDSCEGDALINYGSPEQVFEVIKGVKGLKGLKSSGDEELEKFEGNPLIDALREYREYAKQVSTYGLQWTQEWITAPGAKHSDYQEGWLHPGDGKLHSNFNQLDAETGRSTSSNPNDQNIPQKPEVRSCFIAGPPDEDGEEYVIVTADMSGAELRIIAELSDSPSWIGAFDRDEDVHSVGTEMMYHEKWPRLTIASIIHPEGWTLEDVKTERIELMVNGKVKKVPPCAYYARKPNGDFARQKCDCPEHKKLRDGNKATNFLLAYGGVAATLAARIHCSVKEAQEIMNLHEQKNPEVWDYLFKSGQQARFKKEARSMFNRRRLFPVPTYDGARQAVIDLAKSKAGSRWEKAMRLAIKQGTNWDDFVKDVIHRFELTNGRKPKKEELWDLTHNQVPSSRDVTSMYAGMFDRIERQGKNHCIQSTNADIAKVAMGCGYCPEGKPFLWHTLPQYKARLIAFVHDELIVMCPKRYGEDVAKLIGDAFLRAAAIKMRKVKMLFDYHIAPFWMK